MSKKSNQKSSRDISDPYRFGCISYKPGHNIHWIQALRSANDEEASAKTWPGKIVTIDGEVVTVRQQDGNLTRFRCHDPARLISIIKANKSANVTVNDRYSILQAGITRAGSFTFSVHADSGQPLEPCPTGDLPTDVAAAGIRGHEYFSAERSLP